VPEAIHRSNRERTSATRTRLLDAALAALVEVGYARASTVEICRRADAPRGTLLHHFPTRSSLMCAAIGYVWERRLVEFRRAFTAAEAEVPETSRSGRAVDLLWQMYSGPTFDAWMELVVAARTDPELRRELRSVWVRFEARLQSTFDELLPAPELPAPELSANDLHAPNPHAQLTIAVLNGLALDRIFRSPEDLAPVVASLKHLV
jgi:AcrR family transcriptional regulator